MHRQRYIYKNTPFNKVAYEEREYKPGKDKLSLKIFSGKAVPREDRLELQDKAYIISSQGT